MYYYYVARILGGFFGGSGYMIVPIFLSEISDDSVRGTLVSTLILMETFGILLAYIIGNFCDFYTIPKFAIALTTIFATALYFLPESSLFLLKQQKINVITIHFRVNLSLNANKITCRKLKDPFVSIRTCMTQLKIEKS